MVTEEYMKGYAEGYAAGLEKARADAEDPVIDYKGIIERYRGRVGQSKAYEIIRAVRHCSNGGKLNSSSLILLSELKRWESIVDPTYLERL